MLFEIEIIKFLQSIRCPFVDVLFVIITYFASVWAVPVAFVLFFFLYKKRYAFSFLVTSVCACFTGFVLKAIIGRVRPFEASNEVVNIYESSGYALPSGHTIAAVCIAFFVGFACYQHLKLRGRIWSTVGCSVYVLLIGISRMYLGQHYVTDILAGAFVAIVFCVLAYFFLPKLWDYVEKKYLNDKEKKKKSKSDMSNEKVDKKVIEEPETVETNNLKKTKQNKLAKPKKV